MTTADTIAAQFNGDGTNFWTGRARGEGDRLDTVIEANGGRRERPDRREGTETYRFADGSAIVIMNGACWDTETGYLAAGGTRLTNTRGYLGPA